jgi:hypothetical protein
LKIGRAYKCHFLQDIISKFLASFLATLLEFMHRQPIDCMTMNRGNLCNLVKLEQHAYSGREHFVNPAEREQ